MPGDGDADAAPAPTWQRVRRAGGRLATDALQRMQGLAWFAALDAEQRANVGLVVQAGLGSFAEWLRAGDLDAPATDLSIFSAAPRELAGHVSLQQTVALIRLTLDLVEEQVPALAAPGEQEWLAQAVLHYSREVGFAAADVYAAYAQQRGAEQARAEAALVEALVHGDGPELLTARAAALGWPRATPVRIAVGERRAEKGDLPGQDCRAAARRLGVQVVLGEAGGALVLVVGGDLHGAALDPLLEVFDAGPVVLGPAVEGIAHAGEALAEALAARRAVPAWPAAPRPVAAAELVVERAVLGDPAAADRLVDEVYRPLAAQPALLATVTAVLEAGSTEACARSLFLHPNTVRYRLRKAVGLVGRDPARPRDALALAVALALGRTRDAAG